MAETDIVPEKENYPMKPALIIGSTCVDVIINIHHLPKTEEDIHPTSQSMAIGGLRLQCRLYGTALKRPAHLYHACGRAAPTETMWQSS